MENTLVYHPYRAYRYWVLFATILSIISFLLAGLCTHDCTFPALIFFCILGIGSLYLAKCLYDMANVAFVFSEDGLQIIGNIGAYYTWWPRRDCSYGYLVLYRGHNYLLLTNVEMPCQMAKKLTRRNVRRLKEKYDFGVTIHLSTEKTTTQIFEYLKKYETVIRETRDVWTTGDGSACR